MIRVKICGVGNPADACAAAEAGADYIGMVFVPERRRRITPDDAKDIVNAVRALDAPLRPGSGQASPRMVGLFADQPLEEVNEGRRPLRPRYRAAMRAVRASSTPPHVDCEVIKVVHVPASYRAPDDVPQLAGRVQEYAESGCLVTLDRLVEGIQGGTGQSFNLDVAASLSSRGVSFPAGWRPHPGQRGPRHQHRPALGRGRIQRRGDHRQKGPPQDSAFRRKRPPRRRRPDRLCLASEWTL